MDPCGGLLIGKKMLQSLDSVNIYMNLAFGPNLRFMVFCIVVSLYTLVISKDTEKL